MLFIWKNALVIDIVRGWPIGGTPAWLPSILGMLNM